MSYSPDRDIMVEVLTDIEVGEQGSQILRVASFSYNGGEEKARITRIQTTADGVEVFRRAGGLSRKEARKVGRALLHWGKTEVPDAFKARTGKVKSPPKKKKGRK